jgi:hypothetical protein
MANDYIITGTQFLVPSVVANFKKELKMSHVDDCDIKFYHE